ncbi:hypothetical protein OG196_14060 [Kitasatospora purpeofusca]|uniref:hypothetical protein n=1 Tax=Kitasatospora purpeofusca TaxID=67352 RepID=UPI002E0F9DFF|nr:hypothetical protein OG196_14060 [Kitasatospora purpeofusca]
MSSNIPGGFIAFQIPGPAHHHPVILGAIIDHLAGPSTLDAAFTLVDHAIAAAWSVRPSSLRPLTFSQFHDLVINRCYGEAVRLALVVDVDFDRIDEISAAIRVALRADTDLLGRQPSE